MFTVLLESDYYSQIYSFYESPLTEVEFRKEMKAYRESTKDPSINQFIELMMERKLLFGKEKAYGVHFDNEEENEEQISLYEEE